MITVLHARSSPNTITDTVNTACPLGCSGSGQQKWQQM
jgi:hypothetical protein